MGGAERGAACTELVDVLSLLGRATRGLQSSEEVEAVSEGRVVAGRVVGGFVADDEVMVKAGMAEDEEAILGATTDSL